jgi:DNA processing protein
VVVKAFPLVSGAHRQTLTATEPGFPRRLSAARGRPRALHVRGSIPDRALAVAIVGSRAADAAALDAAFRIGREVAAAGGLVVSGGALGVDGAAHRGALDAGGPTVAVLGCGVDVVYPVRHGRMFDAMIASGGGVASPFADGTLPLPGLFVRRNAIIAGLADAVVVVAARGRSGSMHTARAAAAMGRPVCAVPGSDGCAALIAAGAAIADCADDVTRAIAGDPRRPVLAVPTGTAAIVLAALAADVCDAEELAGRTGLSVREVLSSLCDLEIQGLAFLLPGGNYVRSTPASAG